MISLSAWGTSLSERDVGARVRELLLERIKQHGHVTLDMKDVDMINSSFADEVFAKLVRELGPERARKGISIINASETVKTIINESIATRLHLITPVH